MTLMTAVEATEYYNKIMNYSNPGERHTCAGKANFLANIMFVALSALSILCMSGVLTVSTFSWVALALGSSLVLTQFAGGRPPSIVFNILVAASIVTLGALGGAGILSVTELACSILGIVLVQGGGYLCARIAIEDRRTNQELLRGTELQDIECESQ